MFGYISINKPEMKFKDFDVYHSFYCGLCKELKVRHGRRGQMTLSYDMAFLVILHSGLYEPKIDIDGVRCVAHPFEKHPARRNEFTEYAADMNLLLSYYKCKDDWQDDKKRTRYAYAKFLEPNVRDICKRYEKTAEVLAENMSALNACEKENEQDLDRIAGYFGRIMGQIFVCRDDEWKDCLYWMGFFLGKFIYLLDAYEDIEEDMKKNRYNPFITRWENPDFDEECRQILTLMMAECSKTFEKLPIIEYTDILRNILYSGVWCRVEQVRAKRNEERQKDNERSI